MVKTIFKGLGIVITIPVVFILFIFGWVWFLDNFPAYEPSYYRHVSIDMDVDGQPVKIERTTECDSYASAVAGGALSRWRQGLRWPTFHYPVVRRISHTMPDGTHLMMRMPFPCTEKTNFTTKPEDFEGSFFPIGISEGPEISKDVLIYDHDGAYNHPDGRIKNVRFTFQEAMKRDKMDKDDEGAWFFSPFYGGIKGERLKWKSSYGGWTFFILPDELYDDFIAEFDKFDLKHKEDISFYGTALSLNHVRRAVSKICLDFEGSNPLQKLNLTAERKCKGHDLVPLAPEFAKNTMMIPDTPMIGKRGYPLSQKFNLLQYKNLTFNVSNIDTPRDKSRSPFIHGAGIVDRVNRKIIMIGDYTYHTHVGRDHFK